MAKERLEPLKCKGCSASITNHEFNVNKGYCYGCASLKKRKIEKKEEERKIRGFLESELLS